MGGPGRSHLAHHEPGDLSGVDPKTPEPRTGAAFRRAPRASSPSLGALPEPRPRPPSARPRRRRAWGPARGVGGYPWGPARGAAHGVLHAGWGALHARLRQLPPRRPHAGLAFLW